MSRRIDDAIWEERRAWIARQADSGLSAARFCREQGQNLSNFHAWKRKFAESAAVIEWRRVDSVGQTAPRPSNAFVPRRLASNVSQVQVRLDAADIKFRVPAEAVELRNVFRRVFLGVDQRRDDVDLLGSSPVFDDRVADLAQLESLRNRGVRLFIHPFRTFWTGPSDDVVTLAQSPAPSKVAVPLFGAFARRCACLAATTERSS